jgi:hypothetical protein
VAEPVRAERSEVQDVLGNAVVRAALAGAQEEGLGPVVHETVSRSFSGAVHPSSRSVHRAMAEAFTPALPALPSPGGGMPLPDPIRTRMEQAFSHDFGHVRIHVGGGAANAAADLQAHAFAVGADVYFGQGEWAPGTPAGDRLLAHELTHVVQHDEGRLGGGSGVSSPTDPAEREAYGNENRILHELRQSPPPAQDTAPPAQDTAPAAPHRSRTASASRHVLRAASAVPDATLELDLDSAAALQGLTDVASQATTGPLSSHKVTTGGRMTELDAAPERAVAAMTASPIGFGGLQGSEGPLESQAPTELEGHDAPPAQAEPLPEQAPPEADTAEVTESRAELDAAMDQQATLPQGGGPPAEGSEEGPDNREEVEQRLDGVDTTFDGGISPPPVQPLVLDGEADPNRVDEGHSEVSNCMNEHAVDAFGLIVADRGEHDVAPTGSVEVEPLDPSSLVCEPTDTSAEAVYQQALAESNLDPGQQGFTENVDVVGHLLSEGQGDIDAACEEASTAVSGDLETLDVDATAQLEQSLAEAQRRESEAHTQLEQQVCDARDSWSAERDAALAQSELDAQAQVDDAHAQIDAERAHFDSEVDAAVGDAMAEARTEQQRAEQAAAEERARAEREAEGGGFWDWVGSVLDSVIEALTSVITAIFDALRAVIDGIFKALEWVIAGLVDIIQELVVGIINLLRVGLELLCHALEATFGEQATRWISTIDGFLEGTIAVLDAIFDWLGEALVGVLEFINQGLQAVLTLIQWSLTALVMLMTGLWIRYLWLAIEHFDRLWTNIQGSMDGLWGELVARSGPAWEEFWTNFWTPGNQLLLAVGAIVFIVGLFVGVSEVVAIIMLILAVLYLATVAVHVGEQFFTYCEQIWNDDVSGARRTLADTLLFLLFNAPLILLAIFGIKGGLEALSGRGGGAGEGGVRPGEGGEGGVRPGEGSEGGVRPGEGEGVRPGEGEGRGPGEGEGTGPRDGCFVAGTTVHGEAGPVPIETIRVGDRVLGMQMDGLSPRPAVGVVQHLFTRTVDRVVEIEVGDELLVCSLEHPFYVHERGWVAAGELEAGAVLLSREGRPVEIRRVVHAERAATVHNIEVAGIHDYFVGREGVLVHNKAMRWMLQDRAAALEGRTAEIIERASALPEDAPGRAEVLRDAQALEAEAARLAERGRTAADEAALEGERSAIEQVEESLAELEGRLEVAELPPELARLEADARALEHRANELPNEAPAKWELIGRAQRLRAEIEAVRELMAESPDPALVDEYWALRRQLAELEREISEAEPRPPASDPWNERLDRARWTDHGRKHMKARTAEEAREMSMPDENGNAEPSQYLPDVDNAALELEALRNGEVIRGDPAEPGGTVHVKYNAGRVIGYDGGEAVTTMRAEISGGDVYHGHPRKF